MPRICEFLGISIYMYFDDHDPPHFHAFYGEYQALITINDLKIIRGSLPPRVNGLVVEWALNNQSGLKKNWKKLLNQKQPEKLKPLK